mmetsp:Transcript_25847/g.82942  ORF Transcript_25847/g.82942 Transcript_25847/m.82942 type:complete len:429 (-) Transcript_25847:170-1456(-)
MTLVEKIKDIEKEIARTQVNKATMSHLCTLRAKLAKYRTELIAPPKAGSSEGTGFDVEKVGDARVALIGFPSVGKSTILSHFTGTASEAAAYEFTTLTCIPGIIHHKDCRIQLLDLPGIIEGASEGKGRGRQVIGVARSCDLILLVVDAGSGKADRQRELLEHELRVVGLRLNERPPNVYFKKKSSGPVSISSTCALESISESDVRQLLHEYKINSAEVLFREDCTVDQFIDLIEGNRKYVRCLYVYNKIDMSSIEECRRIMAMPDTMVLSCRMRLNSDVFAERLWECADLDAESGCSLLLLALEKTRIRLCLAVPQPHHAVSVALVLPRGAPECDALARARILTRPGLHHAATSAWCACTPSRAARSPTSTTRSSSPKGGTAPPSRRPASTCTAHWSPRSTTRWCGAPRSSTRRSAWAWRTRCTTRT